MIVEDDVKLQIHPMETLQKPASYICCDCDAMTQTKLNKNREGDSPRIPNVIKSKKY